MLFKKESDGYRETSGRPSPASPDRRESSKKEMVAVQESPLTEDRMLLKNIATCFFLTLKNWGVGEEELGHSIREKLVINMLI